MIPNGKNKHPTQNIPGFLQQPYSIISLSHQVMSFLVSNTREY